MKKKQYHLMAITSFAFCILLSSCAREDLTPSDNILSLSFVKDSIPADDASFLEIIAKVSPNVSENNKSITFETTHGSFANGNVKTVDINGEARIFLRNNSIGITVVKATVGAKYSREITVHFIRSNPENISVNPAASSITNAYSQNVNVTAQLTRFYGMPSPDFVVNFSAFDISNNGRGIFINNNVASQLDGKATSTFWLQDTSFVGYITLKAFVVITPGDTIEGSNRIFVQHQ